MTIPTASLRDSGHTPGPLARRDLAWGRNAVAFIRERGLEADFNNWCGGWPCPVELVAPDLLEALESIERKARSMADARDTMQPGLWEACADEARAAIAKAKGSDQ